MVVIDWREGPSATARCAIERLIIRITVVGVKKGVGTNHGGMVCLLAQHFGL